MGLDIYKHRVGDSGNEKHIVEVNHNVGSPEEMRLKERFKSFLQSGEEYYINLQETLARVGLSHQPYEIVGFGANEKGSYVTVGNGEKYVDVYDKDTASDLLPITYLNIEEVAYQRGGMELGWRDAIREKFDLDEDWCYLTTPEQLDFAKTFCVSGCPMLEWDLGENEYIYFWY